MNKFEEVIKYLEVQKQEQILNKKEMEQEKESLMNTLKQVEDQLGEEKKVHQQLIEEFTNIKFGPKPTDNQSNGNKSVSYQPDISFPKQLFLSIKLIKISNLEKLLNSWIQPKNRLWAYLFSRDSS